MNTCCAGIWGRKWWLPHGPLVTKQNGSWGNQNGPLAPPAPAPEPKSEYMSQKVTASYSKSGGWGNRQNSSFYIHMYKESYRLLQLYARASNNFSHTRACSNRLAASFSPPPDQFRPKRAVSPRPWLANTMRKNSNDETSHKTETGRIERCIERRDHHRNRRNQNYDNQSQADDAFGVSPVAQCAVDQPRWEPEWYSMGSRELSSRQLLSV
jgi:hypothetical protein